MNDIVERARKIVELRGDTYSSYEVIGLLGEIMAEIERLRADIDFHLNTIGRQTGEIERLELEVASWKQSNDLKTNEIKRLVRSIVSDITAQAEIERLELEAASWKQSSDLKANEIKQLRAEFDQLFQTLQREQAEIERLASAFDDCVENAENWKAELSDIVHDLRESAKHSRMCGWTTHAFMDDKAAAEIEQLRLEIERLKDALFEIEMYSDNHEAARKRARRALEGK